MIFRQRTATKEDDHDAFRTSWQMLSKKPLYIESQCDAVPSGLNFGKGIARKLDVGGIPYDTR